MNKQQAATIRLLITLVIAGIAWVTAKKDNDGTNKI